MKNLENNSEVKKGRGRPKKVQSASIELPVNVKTVKMSSLSFDKNLFVPMVTKTKVDKFFSAEGGVMPGTNIVVTGDPGVGKTTVLLDIIGDLHKQGKKVLFISGEMNAIDMVGYCKRFPKFNDLDILFLGDYAEHNPEQVIKQALQPGYDVVLIDSLAEVADTFVDYHGGTAKGNTNKLLNLFDEHNVAKNDSKTNTTFLIIQQVTKGGGFVGSNKIKHMVTGMMHLKFEDGERYLVFSKNRRGGSANRLFFNLRGKNKVNYLHEDVHSPLV